MNIDYPRRNRIDLLTPAEKAIYDAIQKVEELPGDERLTDAICLLQDAQNKVSDYVDNKPKRNFHNFICRECGYGIGGIMNNDVQMLNYVNSWTTHIHPKFKTRCNHQLEEVTEKEFIKLWKPECFY